jgi:hypothetical protein
VEETEVRATVLGAAAGLVLLLFRPKPSPSVARVYKDRDEGEIRPHGAPSSLAEAELQDDAGLLHGRAWLGLLVVLYNNYPPTRQLVVTVK